MDRKFEDDGGFNRNKTVLKCVCIEGCCDEIQTCLGSNIVCGLDPKTDIDDQLNGRLELPSTATSRAIRRHVIFAICQSNALCQHSNELFETNLVKKNEIQIKALHVYGFNTCGPICPIQNPTVKHMNYLCFFRKTSLKLESGKILCINAAASD